MRKLVLTMLLLVSGYLMTIAQVRNGKLVSIDTKASGSYFKPLDELKISVQNAKGSTIVVWDGQSEEYLRLPAQEQMTITIGGALGGQSICLIDKKGVIIDKAGFDVNCKTEINDENGYYKGVLRMLYNTMVGGHKQGGNEANTNFVDGQFYNYFVCWLRDHVHTLKGMKYFYNGDIKSGIDLYANYQRKDGMIFDNLHSRNGTNYWDVRFTYGDFILPVDGGNYEFKRIPVEADVEYLFIEGIYYTWKATGDNVWMTSRMDHALKALHYSTTDPYRWSEKYQLVKRGYTIDTWDFQNSEDAQISAQEGKSGDPMVINTGRTRFNVMHGDNTGLAIGCMYLAEMLDFSGRKEEAEKVRKQGKELMDRLYKTSWNGAFFTHMVPEDPSIVRDLGVDEKSQVSLSNAYGLNRGIDHEKAVEIIKTYQRIKREMPKSSPGEFYGIYPPFTKGYGGHSTEWEYVNGGVTAMVGGELAHGAFEHGYETYGVDILNRLYEFSKQFGEYLHDTYRGSMPEDPKRNFEMIDIKAYANVDFDGSKGAKGVPAWTNEGDNDFKNCPTGKMEIEKIPFTIINPADNARKACIGLSGSQGYKLNTSIPLNKKAKSIYFVHTLCIKSGSGTSNAGNIVIRYTDNTSFLDVVDNSKIGNWWYPSNIGGRKGGGTLKAFGFANGKATAVGAYLYGLNNPYPDKTIKSIELQGYALESKWMILGITLSDYPVYFTPDIISYGMPANWCAAAVVSAMVEGLAGVKDKGVSFDKVLFAPRWAASEVKKVNTTIKYGMSNGYVSYKYNHQGNVILIEYTGNAKNTLANIMLPQGKTAKSIRVNGLPIAFTNEKVEQSAYAVFPIDAKGVSKIECTFE